MPAGLIVAGPTDGNVGQEVSLGAEVAAHAEREGVLVVRVVHAEEVCADAQVAKLRNRLQAPIRTAGTVDADVGLNMIAGEILAADAEVES